MRTHVNNSNEIHVLSGRGRGLGSPRLETARVKGLLKLILFQDLSEGAHSQLVKFLKYIQKYHNKYVYIRKIYVT